VRAAKRVMDELNAAGLKLNSEVRNPPPPRLAVRGHLGMVFMVWSRSGRATGDYGLGARKPTKKG
jgi:hypothetical protein